MEVHHKIKPPHGWREFLFEIGTIVLGVLLALGAEQGVEAVHWSHKIENAEAAMRLELAGDDGPQGYVRAAASECLRNQLMKMRDALDAGVDRRVFRAMASDYRPPVRTWDDQAWKTVLASDVGTHMDADRLVKWSTPYNFMPLIQQSAASEVQDQVSLKTGRSSAGPLSEAETDRLLLAIDNLIARNRSIGGWSLGLLATMEDVGAGLSEAQKTRRLADTRKVYGSCVVAPDTNRYRKLGQTDHLDMR